MYSTDVIFATVILHTCQLSHMSWEIYGFVVDVNVSLQKSEISRIFS